MAYQVARKTHGRRTRTKKQRESGNSKGFVQFIICGGVFSLLVVLNLVLPREMARVEKFFREKMESNIDVQAVFSNIGSAISGEQSVKDAAQEVYVEVFGAEEDAVAVMGEERKIEEKEETAMPQREVVSTEHIYTVENMPEDAALEQKVLGFDYCTPVVGTLTSPYGYREHPVEGMEKFHYGLDIAAVEGTEICAFAAGTVSACGESSSLGKYLIVEHEGDITTLYAHCSKLNVSSGQKVSMGEKIAEVGQTGVATGDHLHFELRSGDTYLDPIYYVQAD